MGFICVSLHIFHKKFSKFKFCWFLKVSHDIKKDKLNRNIISYNILRIFNYKQIILGKVWIQIISISSCQFKIGIIFLITFATLFLKCAPVFSRCPCNELAK